jgi:hypothetical protein
MADVGLATASVLMVVAYMATFETAMMVIACCERAESMASKSRETFSGWIDTYEALAGNILGLAGTTAVVITKNLYLLGLLVVYILLVIDGVREWVKLEAQTVRWAIVAPMFVMIGNIKDLKQIKRFAVFAVWSAFLQCGLVGFGSYLSMLEPAYSFPRLDVMKGSLLDIGAVMATCLFSCGSVVCTVPSVRMQMARPHELPSALRTALIIVLAIYLCVMIFCYSAYGPDIAGNALDSITNACPPIRCMVGAAGAAFMTANLCISSPSIAFFVISTFEASGSRQIHTTLSFQNVVFRVSLMLLLIMIGMVLPHPKEVIGFISASVGGCNCLVFPLILYYKLKRTCSQSQHPEQFGNHWIRDLILHTGVALVAVVGMAFGIVGATSSLLDKLS